MSSRAWKFLGRRRKHDFRKYSFPRGIKSDITFMIGEKETTPDFYAKNIEKRYQMWLGKKKKIIVSDAEHDLSSGNYLRAIEKELKG